MLADLAVHLAAAEQHPASSHQRVRWLEQLTGIVAYEVWRQAAPVDVFDDARWTA